MTGSSKARPKRGRLVVLSGPSGSGKTTICKALAGIPGVAMSVSATTRPRRAGEVDGEDYYFLGDEDFEAHVRRGDFLEHARYNGNRYGTLRRAVETKVRKGCVVILEIEVQGTRQLREAQVDATYVFVMPPSLEELEARLGRRKTEDQTTIRKRLELARGEMDMAHLYDHVVINKDVAAAVAEVRAILGLIGEVSR